MAILCGGLRWAAVPRGMPRGAQCRVILQCRAVPCDTPIPCAGVRWGAVGRGGVRLGAVGCGGVRWGAHTLILSLHIGLAS